MSAEKLDNENKKMWAYFAPDGSVQVRSIADTKSLCREMVAAREWDYATDEKITYKHYEAKGFTIHRVQFSVTVIK